MISTYKNIYLADDADDDFDWWDSDTVLSE